MKTTRLLFLFIIFNSAFKMASAQAGEWTWMKGDSTPNSIGNYGVQGVPSATNVPPALYACGYWTDTAGNFWIYGGDNLEIDSISYYGGHDLWKFDWRIMQWTWMGGNSVATFVSGPGIFNSGNFPGPMAYGMFTWVTANNHLWVYQGNLWQYDPAINQWAYFITPIEKYGTKGHGDSTTGPSERLEATSAWTDSAGNLWMFGGEDGNPYDDTWEYDVNSGIWTWMSGSQGQLVDDTGNYGIMGQPSVNNCPPARSTNFSWKDKDGNFWLVGGRNGLTDLQDVWMFNPQTLEWTWVSGVRSRDGLGYGTPCVIQPSNIMEGKYENRANWSYSEDIKICFGGYNDIYGTEISGGIWAYQPGKAQWIDLSYGAELQYGLPGVANPANNPGPRIGSVGFKDAYNRLWLFGGVWYGYGYNAPDNYYNDLWMYIVDTTCVGKTDNLSVLQDSIYTTAASCNSVCNGSGGVVVTGGTGPYIYHWQPTGDTTAAISNLCTGTYYVTTTDANSAAITDSITIFAPKQDTLKILADTNAICFGDSIKLCSPSGFVSYEWNTGDSGLCIQAKQPGGYYAVVSANNGCTTSTDTFDVSVYPVPLDSVYTDKNIFCTGDSVPVCAEPSFFTYRWNVGGTDICIYAKEAGEYYVTLTDANGCTAESNHISFSVYSAQDVSIDRNGDTLSSFGAVAYQWLLNGNVIANATGTVYVANEPGLYVVEVTDSNGCTTTSNPVLITGINELTENDSVLLYPNPNSAGSWQLVVNNNLLGSNMEVYDEQGRMVSKSKIRNLKSEIDLNVESGVYYLRISNADATFLKKLLKM